MLILGTASAVNQAEAATLKARTGRAVVSLAGKTISNGTALTTVKLSKKKRPATISAGLELRRQPTGSAYRVLALVSKSGKTTVVITRVVGGRQVTLATKKLSLKVKKGKTIRIQGSVTGDSRVSLAGRVWLKGKRTPSWQARAIDSSSANIASSGRVAVTLRAASTKKVKTVSVKFGAVTVANSAPAWRAPTVKPNAAATGVPSGTQLRVYDGDLVITRAGTRIDRLDVRGFIRVKAPNVTISRSIVRGRNLSAKEFTEAKPTGLITNYGYDNLLVTDTLVQADQQSVLMDGIKGWDFTARRVHVVGNVDSIKIQGDNVRVENSLLEDTTWFASDPSQRGGPTHNDNIQIQQGRNIFIGGNTIRGAQNFAILGAASIGNTPNLVITNNWLDGGHCTVKLETKSSYQLGTNLTANVFGPNREVSYCPVQVTSKAKVAARGNIYEETGRPISIYYHD